MSYLWAGLVAVGAYCIGAIPFALVVGVLVGRLDIRKHGSGNVGATNVGRLLGRGWGFVVFILDAGKGFLPVFLTARFLVPVLGFSETGKAVVEVLAALATIIGHTFPLYLGFKGGKGVSTTAGVFGALHWPTMVCVVAGWGVLVLVTRYVSVASIIAAAGLPVIFALFNRAVVFNTRLPVFVACCAIAGLIIWRHRTNIGRLRAGTEARVGAPKPPVDMTDATALKG
ncbi:MAG: glycerol-3-phosphate 1-O-acyltransferase PlsY [Planctomycetota bacterium]